MNIDKCFEIADYLQQTEPVSYDEQKLGAEAIWWLIEQNRQQQAEIEALLQFITERGETGQLIIWKAQKK